MPIVQTTAELQGILDQIIEQVFDEVSDIILKTFKENYIQKMVYNSHGTNAFYVNDAGQEFKEAWIWTPIKRSATEITRTMFYNWSQMDRNPSEWGTIGIHGSLISPWDEDERPYLMDTLNKVGRSSHLNVSVYRPQAYWNEFINDYVTSGKLKILFDNTFAKYGIKSG